MKSSTAIVTDLKIGAAIVTDMKIGTAIVTDLKSDTAMVTDMKRAVLPAIQQNITKGKHTHCYAIAQKRRRGASNLTPL